MHTHRGSSDFTEGLYTKYVCLWKVPAVLLQKYFDKLTPYGSFYITEIIMLSLSLSLLLALSLILFPLLYSSLPPTYLSPPSHLKTRTIHSLFIYLLLFE